MRTFLNGAGVDVTGTVKSYLQSAAQVQLADLFLIGEQEDPQAYYLASWESPLNWPLWGTFKAASIDRGKITSQLGLEVDSLDIGWRPPIGVFTNDPVTTSPYQKALFGFFDNKKVRVWRTVMPSPGDANTFGACEVFGGRVAQVKVERGQITLTANSFLDVVNQVVPPNVIELNNTLANYAGATPVVADGETIVPQFTVVAPSTPENILAVCTAPSAGKIYGTNKFRSGYIVFNPGTSLAGYFSAVASQASYNAGHGVHYNQFLVLSPFPWAPSPGDTFYASTKPPINLQDAAAGFAYLGFPYVPQPESAL